MGLRDDLVGFGKAAASAAAEALWDLSKARGDDSANTDDKSSRAPGGAQEDTALSAPVPTDKASEDPKTLMWDPFAIVEQLGYKERASPITYGTLKGIVYRMPIVETIIKTRIDQIAAFAKPQHNRYEMGFRVKLRDADAKPSKADREWSKQMEATLMRTGVTDNPRGRDNFETFLRKLTRDSMTIDQACFEIVPNRKGQPAEWYAVDASTIRLAQSARVHINEDLDDEVRFVQIYDSMIIAEYTQEEMAFGVRNPRTDIRMYGYGTSELEMLIQTITSLLWAWEYNSRFFSQGSSAKGLINFKGVLPEKQMKAFRRHWYQMLSGAANAWRTPITNAQDGIEFVSMQVNNRDMEFNAWMDFLIKVACAMYSMDPSEVNFKYGNSGQKGGLSEDSNKDKITESRVRGLQPLLMFLQTMINKHIVWPVNENFEFVFVGLNSLTQDEMATLNQKRVKTMMTVDEIRAEEDRPPLPDGMGELILDPTFMQFYMAQKQAAAGGPPGADGAPGGPPGAAPEDDAGSDDDNPDFKKLMQQTQDDGDDEDDADEDTTQKSLTPRRNVVVDLQF